MSTVQIADGASRAGDSWRIAARGGAIVFLLLVQVAILDTHYSFRDAVDGTPSAAWQFVNDSLQAVFYAGLYAGLALAVLTFAQYRSIAGDWIAAARDHRWGRWLAAQGAMLAILLATVPLFDHPGQQTPWLPFTLWISGCGVLFACAALTFAPLSFWRTFVVRNAANLVIAAIAGGLTNAAVALSSDSWHSLSAATLYTTYALLSVIEPSAFMEASTRLIGAENFRVTIEAPCSGYEGIGMVLVMLGLYIFAFWRDLRFPHVLALLPIGALTIWLLNAVRLTALIEIGAHISPDVALNGFHSQAGWIIFLAVTVSLMALAHRASIFRKSAHAHAASADPALRLATALLAPFAALMAARILGAVFGEGGRWASVLLIAAPILVIWLYRDLIRQQLSRITAEPILIGLAVGALWIATQTPAQSGLGAWLTDQPPAQTAAWLALRVLGFALVVPIAEELAFRGYLHRALVGRRFESVAPGAFGWLAFIVTSLLFGAMHARWVAGALAGAAFAITLYRSKTLAAPVAAHVAANGAIAAYAIAMARWDLL